MHSFPFLFSLSIFSMDLRKNKFLMRKIKPLQMLVPATSETQDAPRVLFPRVGVHQSESGRAVGCSVEAGSRALPQAPSGEK